jgi:hypothetical protein
VDEPLLAKPGGLIAIKREVWGATAASSNFASEQHRMVNARLPLDVFIETLDTKLRARKPETAAQVCERVAEIISLADQDVLDLLRSRAREQEVLDILDEPAPTR